MNKHMQTSSFGSKPPLLVPGGAILDRAHREACRQDFVSFIEMVFTITAPGRLYLPNWHIQAIAHVLEQVRLGRIKRLIINLPPRFLKSLIASVAFPVFTLGHDPTRRVVGISYGLELATKFGQDCRTVMSSAPYRAIFPRTRLLRANETELVTTQSGYRFATSIDGTLTGLGGDIIILDDPLKSSDAASDTKREHVNEFYRSTVLSRLDDNVNGAIIIVTQRLHADDLCGMLQNKFTDWTVLKLPLIAEQDETIQIGENKYHFRREGDLLHPEWLPQSLVDERRNNSDAATFSAQYQQSPDQPRGYLIKRDAIQRYEALPSDRKSARVIQSWDTAVKTDPNNDYSACVTLALDQHGNYHVAEVLRSRFLYHELKAQALAQARKHRPNIILVAEVGLGREVIKDLQRAGFQTKGVIPQHDKLTRVSIQLEKFENGQVLLPGEALWLADFENELFAFPNGRYDDQVDALMHGLAYKDACPWNEANLKRYGDLLAALCFDKMLEF